jgi:type IV pilus assembly protein PilF
MMRNTEMMKVLVCGVLISTLISCAPTTTTKSVKPDPAEIATRKSNVLINLGMVYVERGQHQVAMDQFNKALKIDPKSHDAHTAIANLYETIGQSELAQQHYKKAVQLAPENPSALNNYGKYLCNQGSYQEAVTYFSQAAQTPLYARPWLPLTNAGQCMQKAEKFDQAEQNYRAALKKHPTYAPALMAMAQLSYIQQKYRTARAFLQRYESVQQLADDQLKMAIDIETTLGDAEAAKKYEQRLRRKFPRSQVSKEQ